MGYTAGTRAGLVSAFFPPERLLAYTALPAFLGAVLAILTILTGMAGIGARAGRCGSAQWNLADEKNRQQELREGNEEP